MAIKKTAANSKKTATGRPFCAGKSGNPSGRPKKTAEQITLEALCKAKTPDALDTIVEIMQRGENERNRLAAAQYIIDRAHGKAPQALELSGRDGGTIDQTITFVRRIIDPTVG